MPYLVYADWLSEQNDPLGQLIALDDAQAHDDRRTMLRQAELRAALTHVPLPEDLQLQWRLGFIDRVKLRRTRATTSALWPMLEELLTARCGAFIRSVDIELGQYGETSARVCAALVALRRPPLLQRLVLRSAAPTDTKAIRLGFPRLTELELIDGASLELVSVGTALVALEIGQRLRLNPLAPTVLGRDMTCDLVLTHESINRRNFRVELQDGKWVFQHLGGTFPIVFNGAPMRGTRVLAQGDRIEPTADLVFRFVDPP